VVLGRGGHVRRGGEGFELLAGQPGAGHSEKFIFDFGFGGKVGVAEDLRCGSDLGLQSAGPAEQNQYEKEKKSKRLADNHAVNPLTEAPRNLEARRETHGRGDLKVQVTLRDRDAALRSG
jgi:hypothetical protein